MVLPSTPEGWAGPSWVDFVCHRNAPWLSDRSRRRLRDFQTVLACRFPTVQDNRLSRSGRWLLENLARLRWVTGVHALPLELRAARRMLRLRRPERDGI